MDLKLLECLLGPVLDRHRAHKFGEHQARTTDALRDEAHRQGGDVFHWREKQWRIDADVADVETMVGGHSGSIVTGRYCTALVKTIFVYTTWKPALS